MKSRVLRAVLSITLGLVAMGLIAYAIGRVTHTEWVWWLAPLTVAVDGSLLLRTGVRECTEVLLPPKNRTFADLDSRLSLAWSSAIASGMAALGAFTGNRPAIVMGAALAVLGKALEHAEETAGEDGAGSTAGRCVWPARGFRHPLR